MKKIILLNPPAKGIFIRDYYCSFSSKANYYWPPQDLIVLSGILSEYYEVTVIDAIGHKTNFESCYEQILSQDFDAIIFSTGTATLENDVGFIERLKEKKKFKAIAGSSIFRFAGIELLNRFKAIDAGLMDFFNSGIISYLNDDYSNVKGMVYRNSSGIIESGYNCENNIKFPIPRHELFVYHRYSLPFCQSPTAIVITSVGCPYKCKFCIAGHIDFKLRDLDNLLEEIKYVKKIGIKDIFFAAPTFTVNEDYSMRLCKEIMDMNIRWICNSSPLNLLDNEVVSLLKKAGCHTIMMGVESGDENILGRYSKEINLKQIKTAFEICKKNSIRTLGYFIIGLLGEDKETILKTIGFAKELDCDFASFDFATPDFGTELREDLIKNNFISSDLLYGWDPSKEPVYSVDRLSVKNLVKLRNKAYREFYLRPSYIKKRLFDFDSSDKLSNFIKGGLSLFLKR